MIVTPQPGFPRSGPSVIDELDGDVAVLLAQRHRDVLLWAGADDRAGLFRPPSRVAVEWSARVIQTMDTIAAPLAVLSRMAVFPWVASPREVSIACVSISEWAEETGLLWSALDFAEAAAAVSPDDVSLSIRGGVLCRRLALPYRGSQWLLRAIGQARGFGDTPNYIQGHLGYGTLLFTLGNYLGARTHFLKAARAAARKKLSVQAARAYHDLLGLSTDAGTLAEGDEYARLALDHYPARSPRLPHLVYDYAFALASRDHYAVARPLLMAVRPFFTTPGHVMLCAAVCARTCAALGFRDTYDEAISTVMGLSANIEENASAALLQAAAAARIAEDWDLAERLAALGLELAIRRCEGGVHVLLLGLIDEIGLRKRAGRDRPVADPEQVERTTRLLLARLQKLKAPS